MPSIPLLEFSFQTQIVPIVQIKGINILGLAVTSQNINGAINNRGLIGLANQENLQGTVSQKTLLGIVNQQNVKGEAN